jgi:hypothetical protein
MTQKVDRNYSVVAVARRTPGHLLAPFGWASDAMAAMVEVKPRLFTYLFELNRARMHLIALALAHLNEVSPDLGIFLVTGSVRSVTEQILGRCPTGIKRALGHLPSSVLAPRSYRQLVELLADPKAAKLLHHAQSIDDSTIHTLRMRRIGMLIGYAEDDPETKVRLAAFRQRLEKRGWSEGRNVQIEIRFGAASADKYEPLATLHP